MVSLYILASVFVLSNCNTDNKPEYISKIPAIESFTYTPLSEIDFTQKKADLTPTLFISGAGQTEYFIGTPFWIEKVNDNIWISDPTKGEIAEFNDMGKFVRVIATSGHGPGELQQPASIHFDKDSSIFSETALVLDSGLKSILRFTLEGEEIGRISNELILSEFFNNKIFAYHNDSFLVPLMNHDKHVLGIIDQNGDLVGSFVNRIVPLGYQPVTHNRVYFDIEATENKIAYAYHGLPLIFLEGLDQNSKTIYDFRPEKELREYNVDLTPLPMQERVSVSSITRDLFINENKIYFRLENDIIVFNYSTGNVEHVISLVDDEGFPMIFQQMIYTNGTFFLINRFTSDIYYFTEEHISKL